MQGWVDSVVLEELQVDYHVVGLSVYIVLPPLLGVTCAAVASRAAVVVSAVAVVGDAVVGAIVVVGAAVVGAIAVVAIANVRSSDKRSS